MPARITAILAAAALVLSCTDYVEQRDCGTVRISVSDSLIMSEKTVGKIIESEYGCCIGRNLDSLDLGFIEAALDSCAAVSDAQAWTTRDGVLHLEVKTRVPVIRLCREGCELLCDRRGYLFPVGEYPPEGVCRISGEIPVKMSAHTHGQAPTEFQRGWLQGVMDVAQHGFDGRITVARGGELRLLPDGADEVYLFGMPDNIEDKFAAIAQYTGRIRPVKEYKSVNLKYKGQIICRTDI